MEVPEMKRPQSTGTGLLARVERHRRQSAMLQQMQKGRRMSFKARHVLLGIPSPKLGEKTIDAQARNKLGLSLRQKDDADQDIQVRRTHRSSVIVPGKYGTMPEKFKQVMLGIDKVAGGPDGKAANRLGLSYQELQAANADVELRKFHRQHAKGSGMLEAIEDEETVGRKRVKKDVMTKKAKHLLLGITYSKQEMESQAGSSQSQHLQVPAPSCIKNAAPVSRPLASSLSTSTASSSEISKGVRAMNRLGLTARELANAQQQVHQQKEHSELIRNLQGRNPKALAKKSKSDTLIGKLYTNPQTILNQALRRLKCPPSLFHKFSTLVKEYGDLNHFKHTYRVLDLTKDEYALILKVQEVAKELNLLEMEVPCWKAKSPHFYLDSPSKVLAVHKASVDRQQYIKKLWADPNVVMFSFPPNINSSHDGIVSGENEQDSKGAKNENKSISPLLATLLMSSAKTPRRHRGRVSIHVASPRNARLSLLGTNFEETKWNHANAAAGTSSSPGSDTANDSDADGSMFSYGDDHATSLLNASSIPKSLSGHQDRGGKTDRALASTMSMLKQTPCTSSLAMSYSYSHEPETSADAFDCTQVDLPLTEVLTMPFGLAAFAEQLAKEFASENLHFYVKAQKYANSGLCQKHSLLRQAMFICNQYIRPNAPQSINVNGKIRKEVLQHVDGARAEFVSALRKVIKMHQEQRESGARLSSSEDLARLASKHIRIDHSIFNACLREILSLMAADSYGRFKRTDAYTKCQYMHIRRRIDARAVLELPIAQ